MCKSRYSNKCYICSGCREQLHLCSEITGIISVQGIDNSCTYVQVIYCWRWRYDFLCEFGVEVEVHIPGTAKLLAHILCMLVWAGTSCGSEGAHPILCLYLVVSGC